MRLEDAKRLKDLFLSQEFAAAVDHMEDVAFACGKDHDIDSCPPGSGQRCIHYETLSPLGRKAIT